MSIAIHIPFYNQEPYKKEGFKQLTRFDYLLENINNLKKLPAKTDIFVHTHNDFFKDKEINAKIVIHNIEVKDLEKGYLTWKVRSLMEKHLDKYEYYIYLEHDIKFTSENFNYWLEYKKKLQNKKLNLGFIVYENSNDKKPNYAVHIVEKFYRYKEIKNQKYFINEIDNYCCFWIYDNQDFKNFVNSKWWNFKKKLTNYRHYYGVTETAALGLHAFNINYFRGTVLPVIQNNLDKRCFVEHITNNYLDKFKNSPKNENKGEIKKGIEDVCKYRVNDLLANEQSQYKTEFLSSISYINHKFLWKFRFLKRVKKSIAKKFKKFDK
jgi:hypothetical protein